MINLVGKYKVEIKDRNGDVVDMRESYNVITTKGRERILDIWSQNYYDTTNSHKHMYGIEEVDLRPTVLSNGSIRKTSFFNVGTLYDPRDGDGRNMNYYDSYINDSGEEVSDSIFDKDSQKVALFSGGPGDNPNFMEYWHCIDLNRVETKDEQHTIVYASGEDVYNLYGSNLKYDYNSDRQYALKVWNSTKTIVYNINTDYTFDREAGTVTFLESGNITDGSLVRMDYKWHDVSPFEGGCCGMYMYCWPRANEGTLYHRSYMASGRYSHTGGESWEADSWPWKGKPERSSYWSWHDVGYHDYNDYISMLQFLPSFSGGYERYFMTYPYVMNKPTNLAFLAQFSYSPMWIKDWKFFKPRHQPQTPQVLALGTDATSPSVSDTALGSEIIRLNVSSKSRPSNGLGRWKAYLDYHEGNDVTYKEVGLFYGDKWLNSEEGGFTYFAPININNCNELFSRTTYDTPWSKTSDQTVEITYELLMAETTSSSSSSSSSSTI